MTVLAERMRSGVTTVARAWVLRRADGVVLGFTDHDRALVVDGVACRAASGMTARALEVGTGLATDNTEAAGVLSDDAITEADLRAGRWDGADVTIHLVDWTEPEVGEILFRGRLGETTVAGGAFTVELQGLADALNTPRGRVYHARCDAVLGDGRCRVDMDGPGMSEEVRVVRAEGARVFDVEGAATYGADWFGRGRARLVDGEAVDLGARIKVDLPTGSGRRIELWEPLGAPVAVGDRMRIEAGCDRAIGTCRDKFDNLPNFRGFPHIPGEDWLMAVPSERTR